MTIIIERAMMRSKIMAVEISYVDKGEWGGGIFRGRELASLLLELTSQ